MPHPTPPRARPARLGLLAALGSAALGGACLAPPPPIVVATPYGEVRAESEAKATEIAELLNGLAPQVREILPGSQRRPIDVWVQDELRVYRHSKRPESVRGFTLLTDEFTAKRIHLQDEGQSAWYLSHELVHALIGPSWRPLPGILEEGLGDVVAEILNPSQAFHIRAHRLLNTSMFTGGFNVHVSYSVPEAQVDHRRWQRRFSATRVQMTSPLEQETVRKLFATSRKDLHIDWPEIPESFYGLAWLVTARIVERHGLQGLHDLCLSATREGLELVPLEWILGAAEIDLARLDPEFLTSCFGPRELRAAVGLQPDLFAELVVDLLRPYQSEFHSLRSLVYWVNPSFLLDDGTDVRVRSIAPLTEAIDRRWR